MFQTSIRLEDVTINPEYEAMVPPLTDEEYTRLRDSIKESGLYEKITINKDHVILDGHHRFKACKETGVLPRFEVKVFDSDTAEVIYVIESNVIRRQLKDYNKTVLAMKLEPLYADQARQRMIEGGSTKVCSNEQPLVARDQAARAVGLTPTTYHRAKTILEKGTEKDIQAFKNGKPPSTVYSNIKHAAAISKIQETIPDILPPEGPFDVIVIDPPWKYGNRYDANSDRSLPSYPTMSLEEIQAIDFKPKDNAILWLWTTNGFLHEAFHLIENWGFEYKACLTWAKDKMGLGRWLRNQTEHCLLAVKGNPVIDLTNQTTILHAPNRGHSVKPVEFYDMVDSYCFGIKVDWFARNTRDGWVSFGTMENDNNG